MTWIWEFLGGTSQREEPVGCHCADGLWKALGCTWHICNNRALRVALRKSIVE